MTKKTSNTELQKQNEKLIAENNRLKQEIKNLKNNEDQHHLITKNIAEQFNILSSEILKILTGNDNFNNSIQKAISLLKRTLKVDAIGVRFIDDDGDFPYIAHEGFSDEHLIKENKLCAEDTNGTFIYDKNNNKRLVCTCGVILSGQIIPESPFFTENGSFWTNDSKSLLKLSPKEDPRYKPRNKCIIDGYNSIALIPVRANKKTVGLLHLNFKMNNAFTLNIINSLETICSNIGLAILRRQTEESLKESKEKYKLLAEETQAIFWEYDIINDQWLYVAPQVEKILGYNPKEWTNISFWKDKMHPDDRKWAPEYCMENTKIGKSHIFEYRFMKKDGNYLWLLENANVKIKNSKPVKLWGYMIDTTNRKKTELALKESERKFKLLADYTPNWEYWMNENSEFVHISKSCEEMTGYTIDEFTNKPWLIYEIVHPDDKDKFSEHLETCFSKNKKFTIKELEFRIINAEGSIIHLQHLSRPIYDESDKRKFLGIRVSNSDITERKFAQEELKRTNQELHLAINYANMMVKKAEEANSAKSEFLANMSHEIRTPLNGVIGFTELIKNTKLSSKQKTFIDKAHASAEVLMDLINDILDFSKIEAGKMKLDEIKTDIIKLVESIADIIEQKAIEKNIDIELNIEDNVPRFAIVDPVRLRQILINLAGNAVKFTSKGKVEISVKFHDKYPGKNKGEFRFSVIDTGIGISKEQQQKLFKPFTQADTSTTRDFGGTGLGLTISKKILEKMDSDLILESIPNEGSEFGFCLVRDYEHGKPKKTKEYKTIGKIKTKNPVILAVEDTDMIMYLVRSFIKKVLPDAIIIEATNGVEGVDKYKEHNPAIVLLDIQMPLKDGYDVAKEIRSYEKENNIHPKPVIALTARAVKGEKEKCLKAGMDDFLSKPINQQEMANTLAKHLSEKTNTSSHNISDSQDKQTMHFNREELSKRLDGNDAQVEELLKMALSQIPGYIKNLENEITENNFKNINQAAHKLKGAASFAGFEHLGKLAEEIEYNDDQDIGTIKNIFESIHKEFEEVKKEVSGER